MKEPHVRALEPDVRVTEDADDPEWDAFLERASDGHHMQNSAWAQVKGSLGRRYKRVVLSRPSGVVAGAQMQIRETRLIGKIAFVSRGPSWATDAAALFRRTVEELREAADRDDIRALFVQLPRAGPEVTEQLLDAGFRPTPVEPTPRATVVIDVSPELESIVSRMRKSGRKNVRRSQRRGVAVREGTRADLETFCSLSDATARRHGFRQFTDGYFSRMWSILEPRGQLKLFVAEFQDEPVAAQLVVPFGDTLVAKHFGWSGRHGARNPSEALDWATIQWAKLHGFRYYDLDGIDRRLAELVLAGGSPGRALDGPTGYKLRLGGDVRVYPPSFCYIPSRVFRWAHARSRRGVAHSRTFRKLVHRVRTSATR